MKAILLAAGEGSRLRPLTINKPKPMVRAANKPIAQYAVEALVANGVRDITMVVGYRRATLQTHFGDGSRFGARITYVFQEGLLGTAHAVATAPPPGAEFLVLGADNVVDANLVKALLGAQEGKPALVAHRSDIPSKYGVVTMEGRHVRSIVENPRDPASDWVNTGVYRFPPGFHAVIQKEVLQGKLGMTDVLQALLERGEDVLAVRSSDLWADAVYPWDLFRVQAALTRMDPPPNVVAPHVHAADGVLVGRDCEIEPNVVLGPGTVIGNHVRIGAGSVLENCIVFDDVQIGPGAVLQNAILGEGARIGARFTAVSGPCEVRSLDGWHSLEAFGCVVGEDAQLGGAVTVKPGAIIGNRARIHPGRLVEGNIPDESILL